MNLFGAKYNYTFLDKNNEWYNGRQTDFSLYIVANNLIEAKEKADLIVNSKSYKYNKSNASSWETDLEQKCILKTEVEEIDYIDFSCKEDWSNTNYGNTNNVLIEFKAKIKKNNIEKVKDFIKNL